ncbi:MAG TPA: PilT/PilU family type 4a pilus ATPase [bacterium]|nr:PilT/PilU family type 4a pilus ATPase [bacterium]HQL62038.1 PilT/PilU family type 4a pilus ATPase [bacterium]
MNAYELLKRMKEKSASDLYLKVGLPPSFRIHGEVIRDTTSPLSAENVKAIVDCLLNDYQKRLFNERPDLDFAYSLEGGLRYRINLFRQQGQIGLVARLIEDQDLTFDGLDLPIVTREFAELRRGLVLLTGATGSGKSTTLAAMINHINANFCRHIMTIEDPIEFLHVDKKSVVNQREVGFDTVSFGDALRHVVRQSPDVILIGEMRDNDTMMTAISAAETGHLVLSTLHTSDVSHTMDRIINYFPDHLKPQVRQELALSLEGIICMRLLRRRDRKGRVPTTEVLRTTPSTRKAILEGELWRLKEFMQKGAEVGMHTFNQDLLRLFRDGIIDYDEALAAATNPDEFKLNAQGMFTGTDSIGIFQSA